jgi:hypothetical protein
MAQREEREYRQQNLGFKIEDRQAQIQLNNERQRAKTEQTVYKADVPDAFNH